MGAKKKWDIKGFFLPLKSLYKLMSGSEWCTVAGAITGISRAWGVERGVESGDGSSPPERVDCHIDICCTLHLYTALEVLAIEPYYTLVTLINRYMNIHIYDVQICKLWTSRDCAHLRRRGGVWVACRDVMFWPRHDWWIYNRGDPVKQTTTPAMSIK